MVVGARAVQAAIGRGKAKFHWSTAPQNQALTKLGTESVLALHSLCTQSVAYTLSALPHFRLDELPRPSD